MKTFKHKTGDTLIEVAIAIGIFSMVAIAVVSVISASTSGTQSALEATVTREEIDSQEEAIRFIHAAYNAGGGVSGEDEATKYQNLWNDITSNAINLDDIANEELKNIITNYNPITNSSFSSCAVLYNMDSGNNISLAKQNAFIIDTKKMSSINSSAIDADDIVDEVIIRADSGKLMPASTFPRLVYQDGPGANNDDNNSLLDLGTGNNLFAAEGIFVVAVKDPGTVIVSDDGGGGTVEKKSAYYDFYVHTCWYNPGEETPSTTATVMRLYNPDVNEFNVGSDNFAAYFIGNGGTPNRTRKTAEAGAGKTLTIPDEIPEREYYEFMGWNTKADGTGTSSAPGGTIPATNIGALMLYAQWKVIEYPITLNANGGSFADDSSIKTQTCEATETNCKILGGTDNTPTRSGYEFLGWMKSSTAPAAYTSTPSGIININGTSLYSDINSLNNKIFKLASTGELWFTNPRQGVTLYATWRERNETITILTKWTSGYDYDSYLKLQKPDSNNYVDATYGTTNLEVTYNGTTYSLATGIGDGRGSYNGIYQEKFVINTLGGKDYYYSIHNWRGYPYIGDDITVTVSGDYLGTKTFKSTANNDCNYWNVFAYKNGRVVSRNTCTSSMEYGY